MSPLTLRRKYLPRNPRKPPAAHPAAAAATAATQAQHPPAHDPPKETATLFGNANRHSRIRKFNPGHEWETEVQCAKAFHRPPRHFFSDTPFYPWLPICPLVNFNLNYKC
nr:MAG: hypothetical protein [Gammatorquevirus sp.]